MPAKTKPPVVETITRYQDATRVWFASLVNSDGRRGSVMVNATDWKAAGDAASRLSDGATIVNLRAETFILNEIMWDEE